jgi:hypothetical protein
MLQLQLGGAEWTPDAAKGATAAGRQAGRQRQPVAAVHVRLHVHGVPHCL